MCTFKHGYCLKKGGKVRMNFKKILICLLLVCGVVTIFTGCGKKKEAITKEQFIEIMEDESFDIVDATDQFSDNKEKINSVTIALNNDYQIEFYEFTSKKIAKESLKLNRSNFIDNKGISAKESYLLIGNSGKYALTSNDTYYYVSYIDDTMVYVVTSKEFKDDISRILNELGY